MPSKSTAANCTIRNTIITALFTKRHGAIPITSECCHQAMGTSGMTLKCTAKIDVATMRKVLDAVNKLHFILPPGCGFDEPAMPTWSQLEEQLTFIARHVLCDAHRTDEDIHILVFKYTRSLQAVAAREQEQASALLEATQAAYLRPIENEIRRQEEREQARGSAAPNSSRQRFPFTFPSSRPDTPDTKRRRAHTYADGPPPDPYSDPMYGDPYQGAWEDNFAHFFDGEEYRIPRKPSQEPPPRPQAYSTRPTRTSPPRNPFVDTDWNKSIDAYMVTTRPGEDVFRKAKSEAEASAPLLDRLMYPTYSSLACDVTDVMVKDFYVRLSLRYGMDKMDMLKKEILRWHPDKIDQKFAKEPDLTDVKAKANVVFRVLNEMMVTARAQKKTQPGAGPERS